MPDDAAFEAMRGRRGAIALDVTVSCSCTSEPCDDCAMTLDDSEGSSACERWNEQLTQYLEGQDGVEALRLRSQPHPPWPELDNPMTGYLIEQAAEICERHNLESALAWAVVHAWFETALDTRAAIIRQLGA